MGIGEDGHIFRPPPPPPFPCGPAEPSLVECVTTLGVPCTTMLAQREVALACLSQDRLGRVVVLAQQERRSTRVLL